MTEKELLNIHFHFVVHRSQKVILCKFPYDLEFLKKFRTHFPSAMWSRSHSSWYLPDNNGYKNRLGIKLPEIGDQFLNHFSANNQVQFVNFRNALQQKMFSNSTIKTYLNELAQLLRILKNYPVQDLTSKRLNAYFLYCIKKLNHSEAQVYSRMNAIKCFFKLVHQSEHVFENVIKPKATKSLPKVLSKSEVKKLFSVVQNPKHLLLLKMAYGMGLRVSELIELKIQHVDLDRKLIHIHCSKNKKDRIVVFPKSLETLFIDYLSAFQPKNYVFEGQFFEKYTTRSAQAVFSNAMKKAEILKSVGIHGLRHSYATHLLEAGTDMVFIQKLLGHQNVKTTEIYAKVSNRIISKVQSPLDDL